jgi:sterol desaturase/sphingolipid hydroxylase (fatty acid hydroxylase superfamily)
MHELLEAASEVWWALAIFVAALPLEYAFSTGTRPASAERLGNVAAMFVNFVAGSLLLNTMLAQPRVAAVLEFPDHPRWAILENPFVYGIVTIFLTDGLYYIYHRLQHAVPLLWHIHALHHTDPAVNVTTARRTHFLERPLQYLLLVTPVVWLEGWNESGVAVMAVLGPALLYFSHMDLRLSLGPVTPLVVGPQYHRIHHALNAHEQGRNFAQAFPLFDMIGGTYRRPRAGEFVATGTEGCEKASARWRPILW